MTDDRGLGRLEGKFEQFEKSCAERDRKLDERLGSLEQNVQKILDAANMGRGAWWLVLKIGAVLSAIVAAGSWMLEKLHIIR